MPGLGFPIPDWGGNFWSDIADLVTNGSIPEWRIDDMVIRTLTSYFWLEQDTNPLPPVVYVLTYCHLHLVNPRLTSGVSGIEPERRTVRCSRCVS